jgi:hypothetical protein
MPFKVKITDLDGVSLKKCYVRSKETQASLYRNICGAFCILLLLDFRFGES